MDIRKTKKRSIIKKYFTDEMLLEIYRITLLYDFTNNEKGAMIKDDVLTKYNIPYTSLGNGTNRMGILLDGYAIKIALDDDGKIDNKRELLYTKELQPYVIKVYECLENGLLAVTEYVDAFTMDMIYEYKPTMQKILKELSDDYLIGDVGIVTKNYCNWGIKANGQICMLDYAYIYSTSFNTFKCRCSDDAILHYDENYNNLICPICGKKYEFRDLRRRITRQMQDDEIGDIKRLGYNLHSAEEELEFVQEFEPSGKKKNKKKLSSRKLVFKKADEIHELDKLLHKNIITLAEYYEKYDEISEKYAKLMSTKNVVEAV